ncbi:Protein DGTR-1 [Aphelenchoides avenae]|nr:Protein DGTR-1 [Aphelenchus avenae]
MKEWFAGQQAVYALLQLAVADRIRRALQTAAVVHHIFLWIILPLMSTWVPLYVLFFTRYWWAMVVYFVWYIYDFDTPRRGSRNWSWYKNSRIWKHFVDYFPLTLVKTADLPPNRNYILGCHPHGVLSIGAFTHLLTNATGRAEMFPGLESTILTLNGQFWFPFRREFGIGLGGVESSQSSLSYLLRNPGKGRLIGIVIGGAEEALDARPGVHELNLASRRGFCRFALKYGASIVPSYSFGENDVFHQGDNPRGSTLRTIQASASPSKIKKVFGFCPPLMMGRSLISARLLGLLPHRKPITTVVGAPIVVDRVVEPTPQQIEDLHTRYCSALVLLFEEHKQKYGVAEDNHLTIY